MIIEAYQYYFMSESQKKTNEATMKKLGKGRYIPNQVFFEGQWRYYTERSAQEKSFSADARIIAKGENLQVQETDII